jgi:quercetin dioxygenase-like cupin family protein
MAVSAGPATGSVAVGASEQEVIVEGDNRSIRILVAHESVTVIHARCSAGETVAGAHLHNHHTDAFYVIDGELTFRIGSESEPITVSAGGLISVPPGVVHAFRNESDRPACWLTIHAPDGGFAAFMRGIRDGVDVEWDISAMPAS